jgi:hypothetical protein
MSTAGPSRQRWTANLRPVASWMPPSRHPADRRSVLEPSGRFGWLGSLKHCAPPARSVEAGPQQERYWSRRLRHVGIGSNCDLPARIDHVRFGPNIGSGGTELTKCTVSVIYLASKESSATNGAALRAEGESSRPSRAMARPVGSVRSTVLICPTGCSAGWLSSPGCKNIYVPAGPKSLLYLPPSRPNQRGVGHRHERGGGMRWTRQRRART